MGLFTKKFTCPFCYCEYDINEIRYICPDCGTGYSKSGKDLWVDFENSKHEHKLIKRSAKEPIKCMHVWNETDAKENRISPDIVGRMCGGIASKRSCPKCLAELPKTAIETPNFPFCIIGVSNSGKTNYITVMLHELEHNSGLKLALGHQTRETLDHQNENYRRIYQNHELPDSTPALELPQIWYIKNLQKQRGNEVPTYTFTIFDGAGEALENQLDPSSTIFRYVSASKAIILTVDPLVLDGVRKESLVDKKVLVNSTAGKEDEAKNINNIIIGVSDYIRGAHGIRSSKKLDIPVAVVLTKFDTLLNHKAFGSEALIRNKSLTIRDGKVAESEMKEVDAEIKNWLCKIGEGAFMNTLDACFKNYRLFGVSSYGAPPKDIETLPEEIRPHRVLDPIFWLLKGVNFID